MIQIGRYYGFYVKIVPWSTHVNMCPFVPLFENNKRAANSMQPLDFLEPMSRIELLTC